MRAARSSIRKHAVEPHAGVAQGGDRQEHVLRPPPRSLPAANDNSAYTGRGSATQAIIALAERQTGLPTISAICRSRDGSSTITNVATCSLQADGAWMPA